MKQVSDGAWQLGGFPPNAINVYMVEGPEGDVLIDAATKLAGKRIRGQLGDRKLALVALTHAHADHQGVAKEMCEEHGVELACHSADVSAMEGRSPLQPAHTNHPLNRLIGASWAGPPHPVGRVLAEGDEVAGFRVLHTPGHTPGHVTFWREADRVAIVGDVVNTMNVWTSIPGLHEPPGVFTYDPEENRRSVRRLAELEPQLVCAGHGPPVRKAAGKLAKFAKKLK